MPLALLLLLASPAVAAPIQIAFLALRVPHEIPATQLDAPPTDTALQGARLAVADNNTTGQFTGLATRLTEIAEPSEAALLAAFSQALAEGTRLFVVDAPAAALLRLADSPAAKSALILDATNEDDRLRGADCRPRLLHTMPSRAMLADALMQYLAAKDWRSIFLLAGHAPEDALYAAAIRHAADKFQITLQADRTWDFNKAAQQADTGHYQVNDEVQRATQGVRYDVLVVADEAGAFGNQLAYRTDAPRPIAGTQGLVPAAWAAPMDEYASTQLQLRFRHQTGRPMLPADYGAWLAVRAIGEAATRANSADPAKIIAYLQGPDFTLSGYKGPQFSFRPWDGQLRQPVLLADDRSVVSISPQPGFLHEKNDLDSLGQDEPESECKRHLP